MSIFCCYEKNIMNKAPYRRKNLFELIAPECDKDVWHLGGRKMKVCILTYKHKQRLQTETVSHWILGKPYPVTHFPE